MLALKTPPIIIASLSSEIIDDLLDGIISLFTESYIEDVVDLHEELTSLFNVTLILNNVYHSESFCMVSLPYFDEPPCPPTLVSLDISLTLLILHQ